jgi:hypothetical protein
MAHLNAGASSISVTGMSRPDFKNQNIKFWQFVFDLSRFEKQLKCKPISHRTKLLVLTSCRTKCDDGTLFLGDGSLAGVPTPKLGGKGIRPVIKIVDDKCL